MPYLAMTAAEFRQCRDLPERMAWMACHFSPSGTGLTNLPGELPPGSLLILDDSSPMAGHDAQRVCEELLATVEQLHCCGVLLDFERPVTEESKAMAAQLLTLPCPVCAPPGYDLDCPVFLPPVPLLEPAGACFRPWAGREIWLDLCPMALRITVTEKGSQSAPLFYDDTLECPQFDRELFCHYRLDLTQNQAVFTLQRSPADCKLLLEAAKEFGVTKGIALWQEFRL